MRAGDVLDALRETYCAVGPNDAIQPEWAMLTEFRARVGRNERSIDALLCRTWSSGTGFERLAVEVKVSRSDYRSESDEKRAPSEAIAHRCAYAAPVGLIDPDSLPPGWGLIEVYDEPGTDPRGMKPPWGKRTAWRRNAARREPVHDMDCALAIAARKAFGYAEALRVGGTLASEAANLRAEVARLEGQHTRARMAAKRERDRRLAAERLLVAENGAPCADCEEPLKPTYKPYQDSWRHATRAAEDRCAEIRRLARQLHQERVTGSAYMSTIPWSIESKAEREERLSAGDERIGW